MTVIDVPAKKIKYIIYILFYYFILFLGWTALTPRTYAGSSVRGAVKNTVAVSTMHLAKCMNC
jgi:hypothetical protein